MLAYWGKKKELVEIVNIENGVIYAIYYITGKHKGNLCLPLVENGKNVENFEIVENEQLSMF